MQRNILLALAAAGLGLVVPHSAAWSQDVPPVTAPSANLTQAAAARVLEAAIAEAKAMNLPASVAIVDNGGHLIAFARAGAPSGTVEVSIGKARTAMAFGMPTKAISEMVDRVGMNMLTTPDMVSLGGGVPIAIDGMAIGAIGVSGGTGEQDLQIVAAGLSVLGQ